MTDDLALAGSRLGRAIDAAIERSGGAAAARVYAGAEPPPECQDSALSTLLLGIDGHRIRVGPIAGGPGGSCLGCLAYWIDQNRPDSDLWQRLDQGGAEIAPAQLPWPPLVFAQVEAVAADLLERGSARTFVDIDPTSQRLEEHRYLPAPGCARCRAKGGRAPAPHGPEPVAKRSPTGFRTRQMAGAAAALRSSYVDYRVGLVRHMYRESNSPMLPMWGAETKLPGIDAVEIGFGRDESAERSEIVAILEALERQCGHMPHDRHERTRSSFAQLRDEGLPVVDPRDFILSDESQRDEPGYRIPAYRDDLVFDWIWGWSFRLGKPVLVPQQLAFYGDPVTPPAERFVLETSNGSALGGAYEEAVLYGLLEVVERDTYMTRWHVQGQPRRILLNDPSMPAVRRLYARALADGFELSAFSIGLEVGVPVVLAMLVDPRDDAPVKSYCASGAHPCADKAILGAMVEVCSSITVYQDQFERERERALALLEDGSRVRTMRDHVLLYSHPDSLERLDFLDRRSPASPAAALFEEVESRWRGDSLTAELQQLVDDVCSVARDVIVVDQTLPILDPAGLRSVKVLAPGLHPITFGHQYRRISAARLERARRHLEGAGESNVRTLNPFPHNFP